MVEQLQRRLDAVAGDVRSAVELLWNTPSVMARFDGVGAVPLTCASKWGWWAWRPGRAGATRDVRRDFPYGIYRFAHIPVATWHTGDVFARAYVRWLEVQRSLAFIGEQLDSLPDGRRALNRSARWRPTARRWPWSRAGGAKSATWPMTGGDGRFAAYKVVDPSFHNWFGLAMALRNQQISDFPLCNKSFNLSYCGHDL